MPTIAQKRAVIFKINEPKVRELNFSEETIHERFHRLLYEPAPGKEEEFWDSLKPMALQSIQKRLEEWLEMEATLAVGGAPRYEHDPLRPTRRSGHYVRELQTSLGLIKTLKVPKVRKKNNLGPLRRGWAILNA